MRKSDLGSVGNVVFKFGGASIKDASAVRALAPILRAWSSYSLSLVFSAMGKTTNQLEEVVTAFCAGRKAEASSTFDRVRKSHMDLAAELFPQGHAIWEELNDIFVEIEWILEDDLHDTSSYIYDQIVCIGELLATRVVAAFLSQEGFPVRWRDARGLIITDETYGKAEADLGDSIEAFLSLDLDEGDWLLTQGFIGGSPDNNSTTLGREGSDYSAVLIAAIRGAKRVVLWKDVDGVYAEDPKTSPNAERLEELSYDEALTIMESGAKVIHSQALTLAKEKGIEIHVRSFRNSDGIGSVIG